MVSTKPNEEWGGERTKKTMVKRRPAAMRTEKRKSHPVHGKEGYLEARRTGRRGGKVERREMWRVQRQQKLFESVNACIVDTGRRIEIDGEEWSATGEARLAGETRRTCATHCACGGKMQVQTTKLKRLAGRGRGRGQERVSVATSAGDSLRIALAPNALPVFASVHVTHNHTR